MCIKKEACWAYADKPYLKEIEAVKAALSDIATKIVKDYSTNPLEGLLQYGADISELRARYLELLALETPQKGTSDSGTGEPMGGPNGGR